MKSISFTGALLAGGDSSRMSQDKAAIMHAGRPLWQHSLEALQIVCGQLLVAGDRPDLASDTIPCYADTLPGSALAGLHTALSCSRSEWVTTLPCDLPFPSPELLRRLQERCRDDVDAVVPRSRLGLEPLIACYRKSALKSIDRHLVAGQRKITTVLDDLNVCYLDEDQLPVGWRRAFRNINIPEDLEALRQPPPAVTFIARSGTGKTTLLEKLIDSLTRNGWCIGALKHDAHRFEIDHKGKDSWRLAQAGAQITAISSQSKTAVIERHELAPGIDQLLAPFTGKVDIVLTEGFKISSLPKIEVHRQELNQPLLSRDESADPTLIGVASDTTIDVDVPLFNLDDIAQLTTFIEERFLLKRQPKEAP
jgi:molybdopterin-guanine dinucleotide biosynthesis protein B/molybdopterin-guanine dinucleotide biosynthesis protein